MKIKKSIKRSRSTEKHGQLLNTYSELNTCSVELHITECKTSGFCSDPILLKKDTISSIENLCPHCNGVNISTGREYFSDTQQDGNIVLTDKFRRNSALKSWCPHIMMLT